MCFKPLEIQDHCDHQLSVCTKFRPRDKSGVRVRIDRERETKSRRFSVGLSHQQQQQQRRRGARALVENAVMRRRHLYNGISARSVQQCVCAYRKRTCKKKKERKKLDLNVFEILFVYARQYNIRSAQR